MTRYRLQKNPSCVHTFQPFSLPHLQLTNPPSHASRAEILKGLLWAVRLYCFPTSCSFCHLPQLLLPFSAVNCPAKVVAIIPSASHEHGVPEESYSNKGRSFSLSIDDRIISPIWTFTSITDVQNKEAHIKHGDIQERFRRSLSFEQCGDR